MVKDKANEEQIDLIAKICKDYNFEAAVLVTISKNDDASVKIEVLANGTNKKAVLVMREVVAQGIEKSINKFREEQKAK